MNRILAASLLGLSLATSSLAHAEPVSREEKGPPATETETSTGATSPTV